MKFWNDDHLNGDKALGVQDSSVIVAFLDDAYFESRKCKTEINYAESLDKEIIFVKLQQRYLSDAQKFSDKGLLFEIFKIYP